MKFTLPKNRIAPLIVFAILSILVSMILGLYQMNRMAGYSYKTKLDTYDSLTEKVTALIKQEVENNYQSLGIAANLVAKTGKLDKQNISELLPILAEKQSYLDLAIVNEKGLGYNRKGDRVDVSGETYFKNALSGRSTASDKITYTQDKKPAIIYATPIIENGLYKGVLLAKIGARFLNLAPYQSELENGSLIYILNKDNNLVSYIQKTDISKFNYDKVVSKGYFRDEAEKAIPSQRLGYFFQRERKGVKSYIWDQEPLGVNNWSVLIGRQNNINPITADMLRVTNIIWLFISISTFLLFLILIIIQKKSNQKIIKMLYLDPVTGGYNWYKFRILVNRILTGKQFNKSKYALINFDINRFKIINDAYGYQKGDEVLKEIYDVISNWVKPCEPFTRYAADQFYILMSYQENNEISGRINDLNNRIHQLYYTKTVRIFYGIYNITEQKDSIDRMGEFASIARNNNKNTNDDNISYFDNKAKDKLIEEENIEKTMNDALKNGEFQVYLQPKYTAKEEKVTGAEALVRWYKKSGDIISPGYFIPVFEKNGFITELDYYMLRNVCKLIRSWLDKGYPPVPISVNISRLHFANPHLAEIIREIVDEYGVPHNLIELELTESAFFQNKQLMIDTVIALRENGFLVSMDDFGAGYSSLNSLKDLPLDIVKLDGELFRMTNEVERGHTVIRNTITMAKDLHMQVVAECIETREQVEYLCRVGCDIIQGYYFAKPMPVDQFEQRYYLHAGIN